MTFTCMLVFARVMLCLCVFLLACSSALKSYSLRLLKAKLLLQGITRRLPSTKTVEAETQDKVPDKVHGPLASKVRNHLCPLLPR